MFEGPETVAAVILEPLQNAGGCIPPQDGYFQRVREICDRHDVLLISDEVICAWGRLGHYFGCQRYGYQPDIITVGQGADLRLRRRWAAMIASDRVFEPYSEGTAMFAHGSTFAGHPVAAAAAMANLDIFEREDLCGHVRAKEGEFRADARVAATTSRSSATCAATATSTRSSWSRTRRRKESLRGRGVREAAARLPLRRALPARADLPGRRPGRSRHPVLARR